MLASGQLGPYKILAPLGAGGMGEVYRARDTRLGREVAVKVLPEAFAADPDRLVRFEREVRAVAALSHPNVLAIHDYGTLGSVTYAVMELLEGATLHGKLASGPLPWREAVEIGAAIAEGLASAHSKGIIHRDLKPENIFITNDHRVKILDFGLASMTLREIRSETGPYIPFATESGMVLGTVGYMSPEQVRGETVDASSDIFSLGCVLYEMVTGRRAFLGRTAAEAMTATLQEEPPDPTALGCRVPPDVVRVLRQCLEKNRKDRLHSARDLSLLLRGTTTHRGVHAPGRRLSTRRLAALLAAVLGVGGSIWLVAWYTRGSGDGIATAVPAIQALAVLPFASAQDDAATESLGHGLTDHIINSLGQVRRGLKVRPFTSVVRYARRKDDVATMARDLDVQVIVTGTLGQDGDDLSIGVELVDAREDNRLWGKQYRGKRHTIMDLQDQIARDVAANLRLSLSEEEMKRLTRRFTSDPEAYVLYREGVYHVNKFTPGEVELAIQYFEKSLARDSNYAPALVALARSYILLGAMYRGPRDTHPIAQELLSRALEIDPDMGSAHTGMAAIHLFNDHDFDAAEREAKKAIALGSELSAHNIYGFVRAARGDLSEALANLQRGEELEPLAAPRVSEIAMCYVWMRDYDQAIVHARRALELDPNFPTAQFQLGLALVQKGMHEESIAQLQRASTEGSWSARIRGLLGYAHAMAGNRAEAMSVAQELAARPRFGAPMSIARIHGALGNVDEAFAWLRKGIEERDSHVIWLKVDPTMDPLRGDPRFAELLRELNLPP